MSANTITIRTPLEPGECGRRIAAMLLVAKVVKVGTVTIFEASKVTGHVDGNQIFLAYEHPLREPPTYFDGTISGIPEGGSLIQGSFRTCNYKLVRGIFRVLVSLFAMVMLFLLGAAICQNGLSYGLAMCVVVILGFALLMFALIHTVTSPTPARITQWLDRALDRNDS